MMEYLGPVDDKPDVPGSLARSQSAWPLGLEVGTRVLLRPPGKAAWEATGKAAVVLAWLAMDGQVERKRAANLLWPESDQTQARNNLRVLVHRLNQRYGAELLIGADKLTLDGARASLDLPTKNVGPSSSGEVEGVGALLEQAGVESGAGEELLAWLHDARQRYRRMQLAALRETLARAETEGQTERAVLLARACVRLEPLSEHWHRLLMDALARAGDRAAALVAYEDCKALLLKALGVLPDSQTRALQLRILQEQAAERSAPPTVGEPIAREMAAREGTTQRQLPLVEREGTSAQARAALRQGLHVVLDGEPGVGKTRLLRDLAGDDNVEYIDVRSGIRDEPYAAVTQLLMEVHPRRLPRVGLPEQTELARLAPLAFPQAQASQAPLSASRLHAALRDWLVQLREAGVRRLAIDDIHRADAASQAAFAAMLEVHDDGRRAPPSLLLAYRSAEIQPQLQQSLVEAQTANFVRRIELTRLTLDGVHALLSSVDPSGGMASNAAQMFRRTGGNPLFVIQLAQQALDRGTEVLTEAPSGTSIRELLRARLGRCSAAAQQLAAVASVAAEEFSVELAAAVMALPLLTLLPAWTELQERGLFGAHGPAHDLVQEATLEGVPAAIGKAMHRQVAQQLERQGLEGAVVLRHWLAAEAFDQALPHAVQQLRATAAAGLSTMQLEADLLRLMARLSEPVLLRHLWLSAEVDGGARDDSVLQKEWAALQALVQRVERMNHSPAVEHWLAFERARLVRIGKESYRPAYDKLLAASTTMSERGPERAWVESELAYLNFFFNADKNDHLTRARAAMVGLSLEDHPVLWRRLEYFSHAAEEGVVFLRKQLAAKRQAARRHDLATVDHIRNRLALSCVASGLHRSAAREYRLDIKACRSDAQLQIDRESMIDSAAVALLTGRFAAVFRFVDQSESAPAFRALLRANAWVHLGQASRAQAELAILDATAHNAVARYATQRAVVTRLADQLSGVDPLPRLRTLLATSIDSGVDGINRQLLEWEVAMLTEDARQRSERGEQLIRAMRASPATKMRRVRTTLEVAECHAESGGGDAHALAREVVLPLRRGRIFPNLYLPEGLVRCADLLRDVEPAQAASLMHVARRWVRQALPWVPEFARDSFVNNVAVNRLLLRDDGSSGVA